MKLIELAAKAEAATEHDRELDCLIAVAVDGGEIVWKQANGTMDMFPARRYASAHHVGGYGKAPIPSYTGSVDAALGLVPDGLFWAVGSDGGASVFLSSGAMFKGSASTPALAITSAALRARAAMEGE